MDDQHHRLVDIINELHETMQNSSRANEVKGVLSSLVDYTVFHFSSEEELQREYGYPNYENHLTLHKNLLDQVGQFVSTFERGDDHMIGRKLMIFLRKWLVNHIQKEARQYAKHIRSVS